MEITPESKRPQNRSLKMTTPKRRRKSRKSPNKAKLEKRLAESRGVFYRRTLEGGCVLIQSDYWFARAGKPEGPPPVLEEPIEERPPVIPSDPKDRWLAELTYIDRQCGFKAGWVAHQFKTKFGFFPPWGMDIEPIAPSDEVKAWVKELRAEYFAQRNVSETAM
jgi:hypothetical protein